jgi:alpha-mannosidase
MKKSPTVYMIGNAHLDPVWFWRWQEGYAEIKATFRSALDRMNEFPEFVFTCACAAYYKWVEENCPEMFEEIKQRVREGRWVIVGGWWIQPDCNIPSGESFVRHGLYSQRYFLEKFGVMAKVGYNVDSFGHHAMLPQILKKSGMDYYVFQRPYDNEKELPGNLFWWESEDGSRVMAYKTPMGYATFDDWYSELKVEKKLRDVISLSQSAGINLMCFYGVGNHGGGPTIATLKLLKQLRGEISEAEIVMSSPEAYFTEISKQNLNLEVVKDELQHHASGCYSITSEIKATNRKAEHRLITAEKFATEALCLLDLKYPDESLRQAWEDVMFNHFHDIMGGCSIKEAYDDARELHGEALSLGAKALNSAIQKISWAVDTMGEEYVVRSKEKDWLLWEVGDRGVPLVVFNPLSWEVRVPIQVNKNVKGITDENRVPVEIQTVRGSLLDFRNKSDTLFMGSIPPLGYRVYWIYGTKEFDIQPSCELTASEDGVLENSFIKLEIEKNTGYIKGLYDKKNGLHVLLGKGAVPVIIDDRESDTWAHGIFEFSKEIGRFADAQISVLENGPIRAKLRVISRYNHSRLQQDFILYRDRPDIEVRVKLNWNEQYKMLKLAFPVNVEQPKATYEISYGFIERPVNGEEEPGQQWLEVSGIIPDTKSKAYGFALLSDSKYSFSVKDNDLRMTMARSAAYADHGGQNQRDNECEFIDQGIQEFKYVMVPHCDGWREAGIVRKAFELNVAPVQIIETFHKGTLPLTFQGVQIYADNIIATVLKKAEGCDGTILRCYETAGIKTDTAIELPFMKRKWTASFGRCEIKTFLIPSNIKEPVKEVNLIEL